MNQADFPSGPTPDNAVFFSRPVGRTDEEVLAELKTGNSWSSDVEQLVRMAKQGIPVARVEKHVVSGRIGRVELNDIIDHLPEQEDPLKWAGDPSLNIPSPWSEEPPTEDGWYWLRMINPHESEKPIVVELWRGIVQARSTRYTGRPATDFDFHEWARITPPPTL